MFPAALENNYSSKFHLLMYFLLGVCDAPEIIQKRFLRDCETFGVLNRKEALSIYDDCSS